RDSARHSRSAAPAAGRRESGVRGYAWGLLLKRGYQSNGRTGNHWSATAGKDSRSSANEGILAHLVAQTGVRTVAGDHGGVLVEGVETADGALDGGIVAAPQVGAADAAAEQGVAGDQQLGPGKPEAGGARRMAGSVQGHAAAAGQFLVVDQPLVRRRHRGVGHAEHAALHLQIVPEELVVLVQVQG